ncbi:MAG: L-lactate dehydrogenase [Elusimicrobiota bacterium]
MKSKKPKISIVGAGNVGSTFAYALTISGLAGEIVIIDKDQKRAEGEKMDLNHGLSFTPPASISAQGYEGCVGSDIIVITAGAAQKPGQSRIDLVKTNTRIFKSIIDEIKKYSEDSIILVVTNPVDVLTYVTLKLSGFPKNKVFGSGTTLDTARFRYLISEHCSIAPNNVHAYIIGEHGDSELPVWSNASIGGMKIEKFCPQCKNFNKCEHRKELNGIFEEVKNAAYKIIEAKGATNYAIGLSLVRICEAILRDENSVLPVSTLINDFYGVSDVCLSLPSIINRQGIEHPLRIELSAEEQELFRKSADTIKKIINQIDI